MSDRSRPSQFADALRGPLGFLLTLVIALSLMLSGRGWIETIERRAAAREREAVEVAEAAKEAVALRTVVGELRRAATPGEPIVPLVERLAAAESIVVSSTSGSGEADIGPFRERRTVVRLSSAPLGPLRRFLGAVESAHPSLLVRELTVRRSIARADRLDAELVLSQLDPTTPAATASRSSSSTRSGPSTATTPAGAVPSSSR